MNIRIMLVLMFFTTGVVRGQGVKFGVFFDPTITKLKSDVPDVLEKKARLGFDFGMSIDYYFAENYAFATGFSLFNTGGTLIYIEGIENFRIIDKNVKINPNTPIKYNIQYVKIPLGLKFKTHRIGRMIYFVNAGLDAMVRASANADYDKEEQADVKKEIKLFNFGGHFGGGVAYSLGGEAAVFGGFAYMKTFSDTTVPSHDKITSDNFLLRLGIMF